MKKGFSLMLCFAMALSVTVLPANARAAGENGSAAAQTWASAPTGLVSGTIISAPTYFSKEAVIRGEMMANEFGPGDIVVDWDNYTVTRTYDGVTYLYVFDPETFIYTVTNTSTGKVSVWAQYDKPQYWYVDDVLVDTATGEPVEVDPDTGRPVEKTDGETGRQFDDVDENAWYFEAATSLAANGIINGYDDGLFHPQSNVTTGELCTIIYRIGKNEDPSGKTVPDHPEYTHWASYAVWTLRNTAKGYTSVEPTLAGDTANRGEAIQAIMALIYDAGLINNGTFTRIHNYTGPEIPDWNVIMQATRWGEGRILDAYNYGIINGVDAAGTCDPNGTLTRAELCQMLYNAGLTQYTPAEMKDKNAHMGFVFGG